MTIPQGPQKQLIEPVVSIHLRHTFPRYRPTCAAAAGEGGPLKGFWESHCPKSTQCRNHCSEMTVEKSQVTEAPLRQSIPNRPVRVTAVRVLGLQEPGAEMAAPELDGHQHAPSQNMTQQECEWKRGGKGVDLALVPRRPPWWLGQGRTV